MRVVVDTNVLVSALIGKGNPRHVLSLAESFHIPARVVVGSTNASPRSLRILSELSGRKS